MAARTRKRFDPEDLYVVVNHLARRFRRLDAELNLSPGRFSVLAMLAFGEAATVGELARAEGVQSPSMTRLVRDLERDGLVRREPDESDGRRSVIAITPRGHELVQTARERKKKLLRELLAATTAADLASISRAATVVRELTRP